MIASLFKDGFRGMRDAAVKKKLCRWHHEDRAYTCWRFAGARCVQQGAPAIRPTLGKLMLDPV
jgi:hypothetical protein